MNNANCEVISNEKLLTVRITGEIDHHTSKEIREIADKAIIETLPEKVVIDLTGVTFTDSSALGLVLGRKKTCDGIGVETSLRVPSGRVKTMFDLAGLDRIIKYEEKNNNEKR